jgi:hypothetical protein
LISNRLQPVDNNTTEEESAAVEKPAQKKYIIKKGKAIVSKAQTVYN